jgi:hypothetical protein
VNIPMSSIVDGLVGVYIISYLRCVWKAVGLHVGRLNVCLNSLLEVQQK